MLVNLNSIEKVKAFTDRVQKLDEDIDLVSGRYVVDAKSILGIFSLDLSKPIRVELNGSANEDHILEMLSDFAV